MSVIETLTQRNEAFASSRFSADLKIIVDPTPAETRSNRILERFLHVSQRTVTDSFHVLPLADD
jgi:hypothetical protein